MKVSLLWLGTMVLFAASGFAHVPYIERVDYSWLQPFHVTDVAQSKAVYSWLETAADVDFFTFEVTETTDLFLEVIVPACQAYATFLPYYAVIGPGLPPPQMPIPVPLPAGYGAIVIPNLPPGEPRPTFFEPFGGKFYYSGVTFRQNVSTPGQWAVIAWNPQAGGGDYVMIIGAEERFTASDILRSAVNTPYIRQNKELHTVCDRP